MPSAPVQVVLGLGFGDEGKGTLVDWLARQASTPPLVIRWNGGPQAMHHVVDDDGRVHCCAQLGAAALVPGARTHLGPDMAVDPYALHGEAAALAAIGVPAALTALSIDPRCVLVTPWHAIVNRVRELLRGDRRHGSTGRGVAEAKLGAIALRADLIARPAALIDEGRRLRGALAAEVAGMLAAAAAPPDAVRALASRIDGADLERAFLDACAALIPAGTAITTALPAHDRVILEGAQGVLLDRDHGFAPHVTPSRITRAAAEAAMAELGLTGPAEVWGVLRAYHTRHGEGPFPSEDAALTAALPELHNLGDGWSGRFRVGWFDGVLARHALRCAGPIDRLAITCVDRLAPLPRVAIVDGWRTPRGDVTDLATVAPAERTARAATATPIVRDVPAILPAIEAALGRPIDLVSWGPTASGKRRPDRGPS